MDLLTQGLLGTSIALAVAKPDEIKKAGIIGLLAGLAADVDFFIRSNSDPLLNLEFHRHFTHSLFFIPIAALVLSVLLWPFFRKHLSWKRVFTYSLAGYLLSGLLDACTSYGTRLLWPLSEAKISLNIISIIDPIFTISLLLGVLLTLKTKQKIYIYLFLIISSSYMTLGWFQHKQVEQLSFQLANQRGHQVERSIVKPTLGNLFLWRSVYLHQNTYFVDAIRLSPLTGQSTIYEGESIKRFDPEIHNLKIAADSVLQNDIKRFSSFSSDYLAIDPQQKDFIIDVRYSNLPNKTSPLWGIQIEPDNPEKHALFQIKRDSSKAIRDAFLNMLFNNN
ncbi:MAG: metal-dependent hydrolase [Gammaproteobacteria bacterium]|jgi:inner membrane protein|nr:metal-dependent hydrolase [Gammaproteobacteria bacterium]MBT3723068.1 metal-dependent hydrolase [Gammaproteobacteria bacterium]MBT4077722.1 metal-dependent hydrolase [Gammaproteobacteria bacterium]MBT4192916.1 metal-dependent hydrolase [Gammaproteobacteria bacterium]MBT4450514.1 metal-dependent hydrolase [Gammaproteobacteria bacterium]